MLFNTIEAAATLTVGVDALRNERKRSSSRPREMTGIAIVGGNTIGEATVDIFIEDYFVGSFQNSLNGAVAVIMPDHLQSTGSHMIPAGSQVAALIRVAPTVSPLKIQIFGTEY